MRIVHLTDFFPPWMGYQETYLAREQARMGHDVTVITSRLGEPNGDGEIGDSGALEDSDEVHQEREEYGIRVLRLAVGFCLPTRARYPWLRGLDRALEEKKPDVVHCHGALTFTSLRAARLKRRHRFRLIVDNHMNASNVFWPTDPGWKRAAKRALYMSLARTVGRNVLAQADALIAIGEPERAFLQWQYGRLCPDVPIVRLGADHRHFTFRSDARARIRQERGWTDDDVVLGHAGTLLGVKGIDLLIRACAALGDEARVKVSLIGKGPGEELARLQELSAELGVERLVTIEPFASVENLPEHLSAMDVAVWPGRIAITAIEAMAVGLPVVACRTPYTESIVEDHGAGVLFEAEDVEALIAALRPLVRDATDRRTMGRRAREAVERELNWTDIARRFVEYYSATPPTTSI